MPSTLAPRRGSHAWTMLCHTWQTRIDINGGWTCRRCGKTIPPRIRSAWQLGHPDDITLDPDVVTLDELEPEHPYCNMSAGGRARHERDRPPPPSRDWLGDRPDLPQPPKKPHKAR